MKKFRFCLSRNWDKVVIVTVDHDDYNNVFAVVTTNCENEKTFWECIHKMFTQGIARPWSGCGSSASKATKGEFKAIKRALSSYIPETTLKSWEEKEEDDFEFYDLLGAATIYYNGGYDALEDLSERMISRSLKSKKGWKVA